MAIRFSVTMGVVPGYGHDNQTEETPDKIVARAWQQAALEVQRETGTYISAMVSPALAVYSTSWGCPEGGELSTLIQGTQHPRAHFNAEMYRSAVIAVVKRVQDMLQQTTAMVEFSEIESVYLRRNE